MNIFATFPCPEKSAIFLDDKRVNKMILESAQMLFTAIYYHIYKLVEEEGKKVFYVKDPFDDGWIRGYKPTHVNHPCNVWVRETRKNYMWLCSHFQCLITDNFENRYKTLHKASKFLPLFTHYRKVIPDGPLTPFANCAANDSKGVSFKHIEDVHLAYRKYLHARWETDKLRPTWRKSYFEFSENYFLL
jgi:hypothetical protein